MIHEPLQSPSRPIIRRVFSCLLLSLPLRVIANASCGSASLIQRYAGVKRVVGAETPVTDELVLDDGFFEIRVQQSTHALLRAEDAAQFSRWNIIGAVALVVSLGVAFLVSGLAFPTLPRPVASMIVMVVYIALSVSVDLLIMVQKSSPGNERPYEFDPTCAILMVEVLKLFISLSLYILNQLICGAKLMPGGASLSDLVMFSLPAFLFTANNILVYAAIAENDISVYGVFRDSMVLWTALIWAVVFKIPMGRTRLFGGAVIVIGLVVNRVGSFYNARFSWAFLLVMLMNATNATGSVTNEYALKCNSDLDINVQCAILASLCFAFAFLILVVRSPGHLHSAKAFSEGFTSRFALMICMQAVGGLLVSRLLKYADSVYKSIGTCLRGPSLVIAAWMVLGSRQDLASLASAFIVASGCFIYLSQGPLSELTSKQEIGRHAEEALESAKNDPN